MDHPAILAKFRLSEATFFDAAISMPSASTSYCRPPIPFNVLIAMAILNSRQAALPTLEILEFIRRNFPYFKFDMLSISLLLRFLSIHLRKVTIGIPLSSGPIAIGQRPLRKRWCPLGSRVSDLLISPPPTTCGTSNRPKSSPMSFKNWLKTRYI